MDTTKHRDYLTLLQGLSKTLAQLSETAKQKTSAVRTDDLKGLDECIKREQALSLSLRSLEHKREALLAALGLTGVPLSGLAAHYPEELRMEAAQTVQALRAGYDIYRSASEVARTTLEVNLHQIEKILYGEQEPVPENPEPPAPMKADIRA